MKCRHAALALILVTTGSYNTLSVKWANTMVSESADGQIRNFSHPFVQVWGMFIGEMLCMAAYIISLIYWHKKGTNHENKAAEQQGPAFNPLLIWPAALLDMVAFSLQYIAVNLTYVGSIQGDYSVVS